MRKSSKHLRELRAELIDKVQVLNDRVQREQRDFTPTEQTEWDRIGAQIDKYTDEIKTAEQQERIPQMASTNDIGRGDFAHKPGTIPGEFRHSIPTGERLVDARGRELRTLTKHDSYCDLIGGDREFSLGRFIRAKLTGNWTGCEPEERLQTVVMDVGGGFLLVPTLAARFIDLVRNKSAVLNSGATLIPMDTSDVHIARLTGDVTASWVGETGHIPTSTASFGQIRLYSRTLAALASVSIELLEDAPNVGQLIEHSMAEAISVEWDRAALRGQGVGEPLGVVSTPGISTVSSIGTFSFDDLLTGMGNVEDSNHTPSAWLLNSTTLENIRKMKDGEGRWVVPPPDVQSLQRVVSNQLRNNINGSESEIVVGEFQHLLLAVRGDVKVQMFDSGGPDGEDAVSGMRKWIRAYTRVDVAVAHPTAFCHLSGITG